MQTSLDRAYRRVQRNRLKQSQMHMILSKKNIVVMSIQGVTLRSDVMTRLGGLPQRGPP